MRRLRRLGIATAVIALFGLAAPQRASAEVRIGFDLFFDSLAPHGEWVVSAGFGRAWRPAGVSVAWRPYTAGSWAYTDYGWTFVSDEPWGWATYHYGRWALDPAWGWVWVPGYEWAPAWVVFQEGAGWIGWAPLPPRVGIDIAIGRGVRLDPRAYCFVPVRRFSAPALTRWVVPVGRNPGIYSRTRNVTRFGRSGDRWVNRSIGVGPIERATGHRIVRRRVVDAPGGLSRAPRTRIDRDRVTIYRPRIDSRGWSDGRGRDAIGSRRDGRGERGWQGSRGSRGEARPQMRSERQQKRPPEARSERGRSGRSQARGQDRGHGRKGKSDRKRKGDRPPR